MNKYPRLRARFPVAIIAVILLAAILCRADDAPQSPKRMENRFLIVIDTSSSMRSRTNGIEEAIAGLLKTDMHGEFRKGDTLGIWTYDENIHSDFPMQTWSKEKKDAITSDVMRYLRHQRYENRSHLNKVLGSIGKILAQSGRLTVILIHDGSELIRGTEFDGDINDLQKKYSRQFRSAHQPMVTVLSARFGQVFDYSINYPTSITIPHTAIPLPPPETNAPPVIAVAAAVVPPTNAVPAEATPPPRRFEIIMAGTNNLSRTTSQTEPAASNPSPPQGNIVMAGPAQSQPRVEPQPNPAPIPTTAAPVAAEPIVDTPAPAASKPEPATPETAAITAQPEVTPASPSAPPKNVPTSTPLPNVAATPPPVSSSTATPAPPQSSAAAPVLSSARAPSPAPVVVPSPAPVPLAVVSTAQQAALFVIAVSLLTIAVVLVVFLVRRSRGDSPPSLISQSIDRGR
jgi:hypothetical protein